MLSTFRGSTKVTVLIIVVVLIAVGGIWLLVSSGDRDSQILRTYHCNPCNKDFEVDLNTLGAGKPTCPRCSGSDVVVVQTPE